MVGVVEGSITDLDAKSSVKGVTPYLYCYGRNVPVTLRLYFISEVPLCMVYEWITIERKD